MSETNALIETGPADVAGLNESQRQILFRETPVDEVKWRKGRGGEEWPYLPFSYFEKTLNEAFNHAWSFQIANHEIIEESGEPSQVVVHGRLTIPAEQGPIIKEQFASVEISRYSRGKRQGEIISIGDDLKSAASLALSKCASLLGIGADVYDKDSPLRQRGKQGGGGRSNTPRPRQERPPSPPPPRGENTDAPGNVDSAQKVAIEMSNMGIKDRELALTICSYVVGRDIESRKDLTQREATQVYTRLKEFQKAPDDTALPFIVFCIDNGVASDSQDDRREAWQAFCASRYLNPATGKYDPDLEKIANDIEDSADRYKRAKKAGAETAYRKREEALEDKGDVGKQSKALYEGPADDDDPQLFD